MGYRNHAKELGFGLPTGIHTRINDDLRISSAFRKFSNAYFESWTWETFLWNGEKIEEQYDTLQSADQVIDLHSKIYKENVKR
jgi:hypothetical protein